MKSRPPVGAVPAHHRLPPMGSPWGENDSRLEYIPRRKPVVFDGENGALAAFQYQRHRHSVAVAPPVADGLRAAPGRATVQRSQQGDLLVVAAGVGSFVGEEKLDLA